MSIDQSKTVLLCYTSNKTKKDIVSPHDFLDWAKTDLKGSDRRARGNALGNIKKAIHRRFDEIINSTHLVLAKDWNWLTIRTEDKIKIIKELGIRGGAITKIITEDRNDFEHKYKLPRLDDVRAHLDSAEFWLEDSYKKRSFGRIGILGLPVKHIEKEGNNIINVIVSDESRGVSYFWDSRKVLLIKKACERHPAEYKLCDMEWKDVLDIEKNSIRGLKSDDIHFLSQKNMTKVFKTYAQRSGGGFREFFHIDMHIRL